MAAKCRAQNLNITIDLIEQAVYHLQFLKTIKNNTDLKQIKILKRALYRYEKFWLPLAAEHPKECLVAPLDIEWVWHCHMLYPEVYETDCSTIVGTTVNHRLYSQEEFLEKQKTSGRYWSQKYKSKNEPFTSEYNMNYEDTLNESYQPKISIDIFAALHKQSEFYYQVSLPHYHDNKFLESSVLRYKQFLYITKITGEFLMPCCDLELIWRTHLLNPVVYRDDMEQIFGHSFHHNEIFHNQSEDVELQHFKQETEEIWKTFFHEKYYLSGAMCRGLTSTGHLYDTSRADVYMFGTKSCQLTLDNLTLSFCSEMFKKVKLTAFIVRDGQSRNKLFTLKHRLNSSSESDAVMWTDIGSYKLETDSFHGLCFQLHLWLKGYCCHPTETSLSANVIEILQLMENTTKAVIGGKLSSKILFDNAVLDIQGQFSPMECEKIVLFLKRGHFHLTNFPDHVLPQMVLLAMERYPFGVSGSCQIATHSLNPLLPGTYKMEITVNMIHSQHLALSLIQVLYDDKMAAFAHTITSDQLPVPTQVSEDNITINPVKGEKAVLIKNNNGDWGIMLGRWIDPTETGFSLDEDDAAIRENHGLLSIKFYKCSTGETKTFLLKYQPYSFGNFCLESSEVDLKKGIIRIDTLQKEIAENIAMAFSVSLLIVLCVPKPTSMFASEEMAFLMAAGSELDTLSS